MKNTACSMMFNLLGFGAMNAGAIATAVIGARPLGLGTVTTTPARLLMWAATSSWNTCVPVTREVPGFTQGDLRVTPVTRVADMRALAFGEGIFPCAGHDPARAPGVHGYLTVHKGEELLALLGITSGREWLIWYPEGADALRNWRLVSALIESQAIPGLYAPYAQCTDGVLVDLDAGAFIARAQGLLREALLEDEAAAENAAEAEMEAEAALQLQIAQNF